MANFTYCKFITISKATTRCGMLSYLNSFNKHISFSAQMKSRYASRISLVFAMYDLIKKITELLQRKIDPVILLQCINNHFYDLKTFKLLIITATKIAAFDKLMQWTQSFSPKFISILLHHKLYKHQTNF